MRFLLLVAAAALAFVLLRRRRVQAHDDMAWESGYVPESVHSAPVSPAAAPTPSRPEAPAAADVAPPAAEQPPGFAYEEGAVPDAAAREEESRTTEETKFDRLAENEVEARREAAARLREDPLTERLDDPPAR